VIVILVTLVLGSAGLLQGCSGGGSPRVSYSVGMGYGGYYGRSPYGYHRPPVVVVGPGPGPDIDRPIAAPLPEPDVGFGMPDAGFNDFDDFDF
jgi:hypothetical protein